MNSLKNDVKSNSENLSEAKLEKNLIYHGSSFNVGKGGGVETYLGSLFARRIPGISDRVIKSIQNVDQSQLKLLHLHSMDLVFQLTGECPAVFTAHNHSAYCPSGTKYLSTHQTSCQRNFSYLGCTWGKIVDGCGSRRPLRAIGEFQHTDEVLKIFKKLKITLIANSDYVRGQFLKHGIPPEQIVTLRYGIPFPKTPTAPLSLETHQNQRILFAGRIVPDKGLEWLLKTLVHTDPRIKLDIAGQGWDQPRLENLAEKLGLSNRITWHGWCDSDKINTLYQQCFAVIFPSVWPEPAGLITLESYARYRPVIASAVGGIPEHIKNGETGVLVPPNDIKKLAEAITELSADYQKCLVMGQLGHAFFLKEFTMDVHIEKLQRIYEETICNFETSKLLEKISL